MDYLIDIIESKIQALPAMEIWLRRNLRDLEVELADRRRGRNYWDFSKEKDSVNEFVKTYKKKRNANHRMMEKIEENGRQLEEEYTILSVEAQEYDKELQDLDKERKQ